MLSLPGLENEISTPRTKAYPWGPRTWEIQQAYLLRDSRENVADARYRRVANASIDESCTKQIRQGENDDRDSC
jgi:hypothetical protein